MCPATTSLAYQLQPASSFLQLRPEGKRCLARVACATACSTHAMPPGYLIHVLPGNTALERVCWRVAPTRACHRSNRIEHGLNQQQRKASGSPAPNTRLWHIRVALTLEKNGDKERPKASQPSTHLEPVQHREGLEISILHLPAHRKRPYPGATTVRRRPCAEPSARPRSWSRPLVCAPDQDLACHALTKKTAAGRGKAQRLQNARTNSVRYGRASKAIANDKGRRDGSNIADCNKPAFRVPSFQ